MQRTGVGRAGGLLARPHHQEGVGGHGRHRGRVSEGILFFSHETFFKFINVL